MRIRTKEELIDRIAQDHAWRIKELSELKNLVGVQTTSITRKRVLCRSGVALLYAHWEGFVKKSGTSFLEYVASQRLTLEELRSNFITIIMKSRIDQANESKKYSAFEEITRYVLENQKTRARLPFKNIVDTQSNLSTTVLKEISWCLGIDYSFFESKEKLIDLRLVGKRNYVAHGEALDIDEGDFIELTNEVIGLMDTFRNLLENSAVLGQYKAA